LATSKYLAANSRNTESTSQGLHEQSIGIAERGKVGGLGFLELRADLLELAGYVVVIECSGADLKMIHTGTLSGRSLRQTHARRSGLKPNTTIRFAGGAAQELTVERDRFLRIGDIQQDVFQSRWTEHRLILDRSGFRREVCGGQEAP